MLAVIQRLDLEPRIIMRLEVNDYEWGDIKPMLPNNPRGGRRVDEWRVLTGLFLGGYDQARDGATCLRAMRLRLVKAVSEQPVLIDFGRRVPAAG